MPKPKIPGLNGVPEQVTKYYHTMGLPGPVVSCRETTTKDDTIYISIQFKDCPFRHKWNNANKSTSKSKYRIDEWVLDEVPL